MALGNEMVWAGYKLLPISGPVVSKRKCGIFSCLSKEVDWVRLNVIGLK